MKSWGGGGPRSFSATRRQRGEGLLSLRASQVIEWDRRAREWVVRRLGPRASRGEGLVIAGKSDLAGEGHWGGSLAHRQRQGRERITSLQGKGGLSSSTGGTDLVRGGRGSLSMSGRRALVTRFTGWEGVWGVLCWCGGGGVRQLTVTGQFF
ncbi:hypothetical protein TIFTF001_018207 [Ficus carica]|uniref:Uncharacterized protein n=1 Tax=Ficus carica TaxID=3494 RepID=A0AA88A9C4_FICCA|nr:hypothetical protein TIFTF001_018207 [Ficus carica]